MALLEGAADEQFFDLSVGQGFERLLQLGESGGQDILLGRMNIESHYLYHRDQFLRQLFLKKRNHRRISSQDDVTYFVFADNLSQAFDELFGVLLVRVPHTPLVTRLRPSTDLNPMNFLAFHLLRVDDMAQPEDEDTRRVHIRQYRGVPRILLIETCQMIQMRLATGVDAVIADRGR